MPVNSPTQGRHSYLLRLHNQSDHPQEWRASLQDIRTGEWRHFADLTQLFTYLAHHNPEDQLAVPPDIDPEESAGP